MQRMNRQSINNGLYGNSRSGNCTVCGSSRNTHSTQSIMQKLREIDFAIYETILYLDAYPHSTEALEYYHSLIHQRELLATEYENNQAPITAFGNKSHSSWDWISSPWPWEPSAN